MSTNMCKYCGKNINNNKQFCNHSCSAKYSNKHRIYTPLIDKRTKIATCICGKTENVNIRRNIKNFKCAKCSKWIVTVNGTRLKKSCKVCGNIFCKNLFCKKLKCRLKIFVKYFGLNKQLIGTNKIFAEINKIKLLLYDEYITNKESLLTISKKYNNMWFQTISNSLELFGIETRTIKQANKLAVKQNRIKLNTKQKGTQQWHTTWNNKQVFLRSKLEKEYACLLDNQQIDYNVESLRISYYTIDGYESVYIPDFYILKDNTVVEIKGTYFANLNDKLKAEATKKLGYKYKYILDGKEIEL